ncbi:MAG: glucose-1-phosphate adenylyltransferase subunit GlgD [Clostridiales bacterium]|nr:glucose-1-phosphate adenylyltransferase subunit GlgD [Clostridiales bacterium]
MKNTMAIIFAYKNDEQLKALTQLRTVSSLPVAGRYRVVDFSLSNLVNSGITKVGMITRSNYQSLMDHVGSGKEWELSRKRDGLYMLPPFSQQDSVGLNSRGRVEALINALTFIRKSSSEYIILHDSDSIFNTTYDDMLKYHKEKDADITVMYQHGDFAPEANEETCYFQFNEDGRIIDVAIDPTTGRENRSIGVVIMKKTLLESLIHDCASHNLVSFRRDILQRRVNDLKIYGYRYDGYISSISTIASYFKANMDILDPKVRDELFYKEHTIQTKIRDEVPTVYRGNSRVKNSLIADGCVIEGTVENSIIFRGVHIRKGAVVQNSIIMQDSEIQDGSQLNYVITDKDVVIRENRKLYGFELFPMVLSKGSVV